MITGYIILYSIELQFISSSIRHPRIQCNAALPTCSLAYLQPLPQHMHD